MQSTAFKQLGKKRRTLVTFITFATMVLAMIPSSAHARGAIHVDLPGISVSVRDNYYSNNKYRKNSNNYSNKRYRSNNKNRARKVYRNRSYNNNYNSRGYYNYGMVISTIRVITADITMVIKKVTETITRVTTKAITKGAVTKYARKMATRGTTTTSQTATATMIIFTAINSQA